MLSVIRLFRAFVVLFEYLRLWVLAILWIIVVLLVLLALGFVWVVLVLETLL